MLYYKNISKEVIKGEIWKAIPEYDGLYEASSLGRIKSIDRVVPTKNGSIKHLKSVVLKQYLHSSGYLLVALSKECKLTTLSVHRLIGVVHIQNPENKPEVNHKKGNKLDNRAFMLEWSTSSENARHKFQTGLQIGFWTGKKGKNHHASKPVLQYNIDGIFIKRWYSVTDINRELGFDVSGIASCCTGRKRLVNGIVYQRKSAFNYIWKYE